MIMVGAVLIAATCISFAISPRFTVGTFLPAIVGIVIGGYALWRLTHSGPLIRPKVLRIIVTVVICIGMLSFVLVETVIIAWAGQDATQKDVDYVIVLGCGIFSDGSLTRTLQYRLDIAYDYLKAHEQKLCVVSGGQGPDEPMPEAEAMKDYLVSRGIDPDRIITESQSTSTYENFAFSDEMIKKILPDAEKVAVVTSDFHVFRSVMIAENQGIEAYGMPAPTPWYVAINCYMREYLGVINTLLFQMD